MSLSSQLKSCTSILLALWMFSFLFTFLFPQRLISLKEKILMQSTVLRYTCVQVPNIKRYACYPFYILGFFSSFSLRSRHEWKLWVMLLFVSNMAPRNSYSQKRSIHLVEEQNKGDCSKEKSVRQKKKESKEKGIEQHGMEKGCNILNL